jgi:hypothetical protein
MYVEKFGLTPPQAPKPKKEPVELDEPDYDYNYSPEPPSEAYILEVNTQSVLRQCLLRWAGRSVAIAMSELPEIHKVVEFGTVAQPLTKEVSRLYDDVKVFHECQDLDLAVWTSDLSRLKQLKSAAKRGITSLGHTPCGYVPCQHLDVHLFDAAVGEYRGRLCFFDDCPRRNRPQCFFKNCGAAQSLGQFPNYRFNPAQFEAEPKVTLFDRGTGYLVYAPRMDLNPASMTCRPVPFYDGDDDVPF